MRSAQSEKNIKSKTNAVGIVSFTVDLSIGKAHSLVVLLRADLSEQKQFDVSHLFEVFPPDVLPHLLAGEDRSGANCIQVDEYQFPDGGAELLHAEVF